jgi:hypothetical protein
MEWKFHITGRQIWEPGSSVDMVTRLLAGKSKNGWFISGGRRSSSFLRGIQTAYGNHKAAYRMESGGYFLE